MSKSEALLIYYIPYAYLRFYVLQLLLQMKLEQVKQKQLKSMMAQRIFQLHQLIYYFCVNWIICLLKNLFSTLSIRYKVFIVPS